MNSIAIAFGINSATSISKMSNNATDIGSKAGSVICQLPNNVTSIGVASLSSITQISFSGKPADQGPIGVSANLIEVVGPTSASSTTDPIFFVTGITGPKSETVEETTVVLEEKVVNNSCCVKWF
jgi:hypothetical protein